MKYKHLILTILIVCLSGSFLTSTAQTQITFHTNYGDFTVEVREDLVPITAGNFIDLVDTGFYDGIIFHRIIDGFMIQGGDPLGTGFGGPGYTIPDEFHEDMLHDSAGVISMANAGPNTGGSQFFITLDSTKWLDSAHAVFGYVVEGMDVVFTIGAVQTDLNDRPVDSVVMDSLRKVIPVDTTVSIDHLLKPMLNKPFPNPFHDYTSISFPLKQTEAASLQIFDLQGRSILARVYPPADLVPQRVYWNGKNDNGKTVPPGLYFYWLKTDAETYTGSLIRY